MKKTSKRPEPFELHRLIANAFPDKFKVKTVYHYTTSTVAEIFLNAKKAQLYCTNAKALNDDQEYRLGIAYAETHIAEVMNLDAEIISEIKDMLKLVMDNDYRIPWVMSFSSARDLLSQWRAYTDKQQGGLSLGFSVKKLEALVENIVVAKAQKKKIPYILHFLPCFYLNYESPADIGDVDRFFRLIFEEYYPKVAHKIVDITNPHQYAFSIVSFICVFAAFIKHSAFREENEYRLMVQIIDKKYEKEVEIIGGKPRIKIAKSVKPIDIHNLISEVWISPHGDTEMLSALSYYLTIKLRHEVDTYRSNLPFNGK